MKKTRCLFILIGEQQKVMKVMEVLSHYEAITTLHESSVEEIERVHGYNKNAVIYSSIKMEPNIRKGVIQLEVGDDTGEENLINPENDIQKQFELIAEHHDVDIGDYITESRCKQPQKDNCFLCKIQDKDPSRSIMDTIIYESKHFYVVPAKGAIVKGYLMIVPKEHVWSMAQLNQARREELLEVIEDIKKILKNIFHQEILIFEHGSGEEGKCKHEKSIVHAHIHILPSNMIVSETQKKSVSLKKIEKSMLSIYQHEPYLLYVNNEDQWYISSDPEVYISRQYFRQLLAEYEGISGELWNWRNYSFMEYIDDTVRSIEKYLRSKFCYLPYRIQSNTLDFLKRMQ